MVEGFYGEKKKNFMCSLYVRIFIVFVLDNVSYNGYYDVL